jgi:hypothetical protein
MQWRTTLAIVAASAALAVAGCGSSTSSASALRTGQQQTHQVDESSKGKTVSARVGDTVVVTLHSTYWQLAAPDSRLLTTDGAPVAGKGTSCPPVPGSGCGTLRETYRVAAAGTATIRAHRDSCGEALRCGPAQSDWSVKIDAHAA